MLLDVSRDGNHVRANGHTRHVKLTHVRLSTLMQLPGLHIDNVSSVEPHQLIIADSKSELLTVSAESQSRTIIGASGHSTLDALRMLCH